MNHVILKGNLVRDPEIRYSATGTAITQFAIAVNDNYKTKTGEKREKVMFVNVTAFGKRGEVVQKYFQKGSPIIVVGRLQIDVVDKDGQKKYYTKIIMEQFEFCGKRRDQAAGPYASATAPAQSAASRDMDWGNSAPPAAEGAAPALPDAADLPWD